MIHAFFEALAALFKRPAVWQVVPPQDYKDRMAQEGAPGTPAGGYPLTDHGGSTIKNPRLVLVYLGPWWGDTAKLEAFAKDLMTAGYLAPLSAYGSGQGTFDGGWKGPAVSGAVTDAQLQAALAEAIGDDAAFPEPDGDTLYALMLPEGVIVTDGGSQSCSAFCGYHDAFTLADGRQVFYSVHPASDCQGCNLGDPFAGQTMILAHEVAEACTDAIPGQGWYNDQTGMENADEWAWIAGAYGPWTVQGYQLNGTGNSLQVIQYSPQTNPSPSPSPSPSPAPPPPPPPPPPPSGGITQAQVDAGFADAMGQIQQAEAQNEAAAWWFEYGKTWVAWAMSVVDGDLANPGTATARAVPPVGAQELAAR